MPCPLKMGKLRLMVEKSQTTTWDGAKTLVNNGINYQPQLVQDFSHQQYDSRLQICPPNIFGNKESHRWYQAGSKSGFGGLIQGQIYNPVIVRVELPPGKFLGMDTQKYAVFSGRGRGDSY